MSPIQAGLYACGLSLWLIGLVTQDSIENVAKYLVCTVLIVVVAALR